MPGFMTEVVLLYACPTGSYSDRQAVGIRTGVNLLLPIYLTILLM